MTLKICRWIKLETVTKGTSPFFSQTNGPQIETLWKVLLLHQEVATEAKPQPRLINEVHKQPSDSQRLEGTTVTGSMDTTKEAAAKNNSAATKSLWEKTLNRRHYIWCKKGAANHGENISHTAAWGEWICSKKALKFTILCGISWLGWSDHSQKVMGRKGLKDFQRVTFFSSPLYIIHLLSPCDAMQTESGNLC